MSRLLNELHQLGQLTGWQVTLVILAYAAIALGGLSVLGEQATRSESGEKASPIEGVASVVLAVGVFFAGLAAAVFLIEGVSRILAYLVHLGVSAW